MAAQAASDSEMVSRERLYTARAASDSEMVSREELYQRK